jgi:mono/diheme cytochrome c family protein
MICSKKLAITMSLLWGIYALIHVLPAHSETRGEMLYSLHCKSCHTSEVHWREGKLATNWLSLKAQVFRWQNNIELGWGEDEITDVTRYLNSTHYHFQITDKNDLLTGNK